MNNHNDTHVGTGLKVALAAVILLVVLFAGGVFILPMLQTVGGSFGYGYPGTSGGRAIRDVVIDVEPQVVYRIDDHRFFTFENYLDCYNGGFVYYNDTNRKIKKFAGVEGGDKRPQNEVSIMKQNEVLAFYGGFIYAASDNVIAYPGRNVNYKYGDSTYFIIYGYADPGLKKSIMELSLPGVPVIVKDGSVITKINAMSRYYHEHKLPLNSERFDLVGDEGLNLKAASKDTKFHCDNSIRPRKIKYISN